MMRRCFFLFFILWLFCPQARGEYIPEYVAVRVIIGEAGDQGLKGMVCVAEVLRRRGSIRGFAGYHAKHIGREPHKIWKLAYKAWKESAHTNYTRGADHFCDIRHYTRPWWVKNCVQTYEYKNHVFYKEI